MKRILVFSLVFVLLFASTGFSQPAVSSSTPQTYTVLVGFDSPQQGISLMSFFPDKVTIHVGDTVIWRANSHEIHTVSFLAGQPIPDLVVPAPQGAASPVMINPLAAFPAVPDQGLYDGKSFANSGIMSLDEGQVQTFSLTFTQTGTYHYVCIVHGEMMSAEIEVVSNSSSADSPNKAVLNSVTQISDELAKVPGLLAEAFDQVPKPTHNADGTTTYQVLVGYSSGTIDLMRFFPDRLNVKPGDTVVWSLSKKDVAPHTVTFLNGQPEPEVVQVAPQPSGPPLVLLNPVVLAPSSSVTNGQALNNTDFFNSGFMDPSGMMGPTTFSLKIGDVSGTLPYLCLLHDTSGMVGWLTVNP